MSEYTLSKSTMERYDIRIKNRRCMRATISISNDGLFNVQSDCGNFSYQWTSFGDCFKTFLIRILNDSGYLYGKICDPEKESKINIEKTVRNMQKRIIENRLEIRNQLYYLDDELSPEEARELWDELKSVENTYGDISQDLFSSIFYYELPSKERDKIFYDFWHDDLIVSSSDIYAETFCEVVAPIFKEILKKEIQRS